jgi:hypothetical protein
MRGYSDIVLRQKGAIFSFFGTIERLLGRRDADLDGPTGGLW